MAEGGGLLNRYRINSPIVGSNPIPSAILMSHIIDYIYKFFLPHFLTPITTPAIASDGSALS